MTYGVRGRESEGVAGRHAHGDGTGVASRHRSRTNPWESSVAVRETPGSYGNDSAESESDAPQQDAPRLDELSDLEGLDPDDYLTELGSRIVRLAAHQAALEYRLLVLIAEFDRREGWAADGHKDCAAWLEMFTGMSRITARQRVRTARRLVDLPEISKAMEHGKLSYSKVRALVRVATPDNESELLPMASDCTARELERHVSEHRELERWGSLDAEQRRHAKRDFQIYVGADGMVHFRGKLPPDDGALLTKVMDAGVDVLHQSGREWSAEAGTWGLAATTPTPGQRRADAMRLILDSAMAAGLRVDRDSAESRGTAEVADTRATDETSAGDSAESGVGSGKPGSIGHGDDSPEPRIGDEPGVDAAEGGPEGNGDSAESGPSPSRQCGCVPPSPSAERYMVMVNVPYEVLTGDDVEKPADVDGTPIPAETARRLACDAGVVRIVRGPSSEVLDVGRRTRTIPPAIRRALWSRDGGCAFPGCGARYASAHHVRHWARGGATKLDNLVLLCPAHHRGVHEGGFSVRLDRNRLPRFFNRAGVRLPNRAPPPALDDPVGRVLADHRFRAYETEPVKGAQRPLSPVAVAVGAGNGFRVEDLSMGAPGCE